MEETVTNRNWCLLSPWSAPAQVLVLGVMFARRRRDGFLASVLGKRELF